MNGVILRRMTLLLFTDSEVLKKMISIILGIVLIIAMPMAAAMGIVYEVLQLDDDELQELLENLPEADRTDFENLHMKILESTSSARIDTSDYENPVVKNSRDLVRWAMHAYEYGWGYVWGTFGEILDQKLFRSKVTQYPQQVGNEEEFIRGSILGKRTVDCVGLIKGYIWLDANSGNIEYGSNGLSDVGADTLHQMADEKGSISSLPETPGIAVWHEGHIGIYIGDGQVIQAANTKVGIVKTSLSANPWTHWLKVPGIEYEE